MAQTEEIPRKLMLFQPYYDVNGHFACYLERFHRFFTERGTAVFAVAALREGHQPPDLPQTKAFFHNAGGKYGRILASVRALRQLFETVRSERIAVVHILDAELIALAIGTLLYGQGVNLTAFVMTQHGGTIAVDWKKNTFLSFYRWCSRPAFRYLEWRFPMRVVCNGHFIAEQFTRFYQPEKARIVASRWGTDVVPPERPDHIAQKPAFLFFGLIRRDKNLEYVLEQFAALERPPELTIAGFPEEYTEEELQQLIDRYPSIKATTKLIPRFLSEGEIAELLFSHQYTLIPYAKENLSNSGPLSMAIAFGSIPVVSAYGERYAVIKEFECGLTFDFEHPQNSLSRVVHSIQHELNDVEKIKANLKSARRELSWTSILETLVFKYRIYR